MPSELEREIKIELEKLQSGTFRARISFDDPNSDVVGGFVTTTVEVPPSLGAAKALDSTDDNSTVYGQALTAALFKDDAFRDFYTAAKTTAANGTLRLRLYFTANAEEIHGLHWELLCDPQTKQLIGTSEKILLSRFVSTTEWRTVRLPRKNELRALIAVANPPNLAEGFLPVDVHGEVVRAWLALSASAAFSPPASDFDSVPLESLVETLLAKAGKGGMQQIKVLGTNAATPATRDNISNELRQGVDILYLVCHGSFVDMPILYLDGKPDGVKGFSFANDFRTLADPPLLVVLASCESASGGADGKSAESAVAPLLSDAGVPAVVAMQGKVSMLTVGLIMPHFFREIATHGQIERAMAVARREAFTEKRIDAWMPALFLRLKSGSLWYAPGFGDAGTQDASTWDKFRTAIDDRALVPILGQDLAEHIFGTTAEWASELAKGSNIPLAATERPDGAKVAQAIVTASGRRTLYHKLEDIYTRRLTETARRLSGLPLTDPNLDEDDFLDIIVNKLSADPDDPFTILAGLDVKVYLSGAIDRLLKRFLRKKGKIPNEICVDWQNEANNSFDLLSAEADNLLRLFEATPLADFNELIAVWEKAILAKRHLPKLAGMDSATDATEIPIPLRSIRDALLDRFDDTPGTPRLDTVREWRRNLLDPPGTNFPKQGPINNPVLFYVYGKGTYPDSLVLTEDDFFKYLIQYSKYKLMPPVIASSVVAGSLLFLGFSLQDWKFRILFRIIMDSGGAALLQRKDYKHVGVQLDPQDYTPAEAVRMKGLLETYFNHSQVSIYWGTSADFLRELNRNLPVSAAPRLRKGR